MNKKTNDIIVLGFALFSMFFGAGNLIFPTYLGLTSGNNWGVTSIGFVITGVGLTMLTIICSAKYPDSIGGLCEKVSPRFAKMLGIVCILAIGPFFAIPRTAATTYSITVVPIFGSIPIIISSIVFFAITLYFSLNENSVMDKIGKILTPILLIMIFLIISKAIITPIGIYKVVESKNFFMHGFSEGYQTMDVMAALFMFSMVIQSLKKKGYTDKKEIFSTSIKTGMIAAVGLAIVYFGLCFVGASASSVIDSTDRSEILIQSTYLLWGNLGKYALGLAMLFACLTTAIGLTCTTANYFSPILKLSYKTLCIIVCVISTIISVMGLEKIISVSVPVLVLIYPMIIAILIVNIFDKYVKNRAIYKGAVFGAFVISLIQSLAGIIKIAPLTSLNDIIGKFPFFNIGMPYIVPCIISCIIFNFIMKEENIIL